MWILIYGLVAIAVLAFILGYLRNKNLRNKLEKGEIDELPGIVEVDVECCGQHAVCEKDSLLAAVSKEIEYYDDEELDKYAGFSSSDYTGDQIEQFREVFYTMRDTDVAGWVRSLQLRGVNLPDQMKDEVFLVVGERRLTS